MAKVSKVQPHNIFEPHAIAFEIDTGGEIFSNPNFFLVLIPTSK